MSAQEEAKRRLARECQRNTERDTHLLGQMNQRVFERRELQNASAEQAGTKDGKDDDHLNKHHHYWREIPAHNIITNTCAAHVSIQIRAPKEITASVPRGDCLAGHCAGVTLCCSYGAVLSSSSSGGHTLERARSIPTFAQLLR